MNEEELKKEAKEYSKTKTIVEGGLILNSYNAFIAGSKLQKQISDDRIIELEEALQSCMDDHMFYGKLTTETTSKINELLKIMD